MDVWVEHPCNKNPSGNLVMRKAKETCCQWTVGKLQENWL